MKDDNILTEIEDLLEASAKVERLKAVYSDTDEAKMVHLYADQLCKELIEDIKKIVRKYK